MAIATKQFLKIIALMIVFSSTALGHNTYFLPGDAFFFTRVDQRVLTELESAESVSYTHLTLPTIYSV